MPGHNIFLASEEAEDEELHRIAEQLTRLSGVLPASSQTDADSYYGQAVGMSLEETQAAVLKRTGLVCLLARRLGWAGTTLTAELIQQIHDGIFLPVFGDQTLEFRKPPAREEYREDDGVEYPIWVIDGHRPVITTKRGARASQVFKRVERACRDFEATAPNADGDIELAALAITQLYVRLIRIHPFGDGNGRTAWAALQLAAGRLRFPFVQSTPTTEARLALGDAIRNGQKIDRLAAHVRAAAWGE